MLERRAKNWIKCFFWKCWLKCAKLSEASFFFRSQSSAVAAASANRNGAELRSANKCHKLPSVGFPEHSFPSWMISQVSQFTNHCSPCMHHKSSDSDILCDTVDKNSPSFDGLPMSVGVLSSGELGHRSCGTTL